MGTSLDGRDDRHAYVGYVFQNLNAFVVNLAPNPGIGDIAERGPVDISNELPTCAREDHDLVRSILRNPVEGIDKFRVGLRAHNERPAVVVKLSHQHTAAVSRKPQAAIGIEVVRIQCVHSIFLSVSSRGIELDSQVWCWPITWFAEISLGIFEWPQFAYPK